MHSKNSKGCLTLIINIKTGFPNVTKYIEKGNNFTNYTTYLRTLANINI
jgi:hypothetical protein